MRRPKLKFHRPIGFIIVPMIDVIFLLILFFATASAFEAPIGFRLQLPHVQEESVSQAGSNTRFIIQCEPAESGLSNRVQFRVGTDPPESLAAISTRLAAAKSTNSQLVVLIRADRRLDYAAVRSAIEAVADNGIEEWSVSVIAEQ